MLLYSTVFVPFSIAFFDSEATAVLVINCVLDVLLLMDFAKSFVTAKETQNGLIINTKALACNRVTSVWFGVDLVACFPS